MKVLIKVNTEPVAQHAKLYIFDMSGYGDSPISIPQKNVFLVAGWSDKIFRALAAIEGGQSIVDFV